MSEAVKSEGSIRVEGEREGIAAGATVYFVFDGDWTNLYEDIPVDEEEARKWFVQEVEQLLRFNNFDEAREGEQGKGPFDLEDRGA